MNLVLSAVLSGSAALFFEVRMPLVQIHMLEGRTDAQKKTLLEAVTRAVRDSLDAPPSSIRVWIQEFSPREYMIAGELAADRGTKQTTDSK